MPTGTSAPIAPTLELADPFICGVGFAGSIAGGSAPYELSYILTSRSGGGTINLGTHVVAIAGDFVTPPVFIAALAGLNGDFDVSISGSDAAALPFPTPAIFVAAVRNPCSTPAPQTGAALTYPGPFTYAPSTGAPAAPTSSATQNPGTSGAATGGSSQSPGLATTGSGIPLLATISMLLLSVGGVLMVAARREERSDH